MDDTHKGMAVALIAMVVSVTIYAVYWVLTGG